jgi:PP-loop superfamily ATP-utilizing enzyme
VTDPALASMSELDLGKLTEAAIGVLVAAGDDPQLAEVQSMPAGVLKEQITGAAKALGFPAEHAARLSDLATRTESASDVARTVLAKLNQDEALAAEVAESNRRRQDLMVIDPLTISAAALLLLVLRIRRVRMSKKNGVDVQLDPLKADMVEAVLGFFRGQK